MVTIRWSPSAAVCPHGSTASPTPVAAAVALSQGVVLFGWKVAVAVAAGLFGREALHGGAGTYGLGVTLAFFIAFSFTAFYCAASRRLVFMTEHPLVCGLFYGAAVEEVMTLVVLPLSALHAMGPYQLHKLILGLLVSMVWIGLPISFSVRRFGKPPRPLVTAVA